MKYAIFYDKDITGRSHELRGHTYKETALGEFGNKVLLKYDDRSKRNLHIFEYVCSELARTSGILAQRTYLAKRHFNDRNIQECVAIEMFQDKLHHFRSFKNSVTDYLDISDVTKKSKNYTVNRIFNRYRSNIFHDTKEEWMRKFKNIMLFDIVVGNSDRHSDNIGFIKNSNKNLIFSPLFDNGNSFANKLGLSLLDLTDSDIYEFAKTPYYKEGSNHRITEPELVDTLGNWFPEVNKELIQMFESVLRNKELTRILDTVLNYNQDGRFNVSFIKGYIENKYKYYKGEL